MEYLEQVNLTNKLGKSLKNKIKPQHSLLETHPELKHEWHPSRNAVYVPNRMFYWLDDIVYGTKLKVWWCCKEGHEWYSTPAKNKGCLECKVKEVE